MEARKQTKTLTGVSFEFMGSLEEGLVVFRRYSSFTISKIIIDIIKSEIRRQSPVLMGACRDNPNPYSIGATLLLKHGHSPQNLSYVIPLLVEEGFCLASNKRPFIISII